MTFDPSKPVRRRDGRPARIVCTDRKGDFPLVVLVQDENGELLGSRRHNGRVERCEESPGDLINIPERIEGWVNVYRSGAGKAYTGQTIHQTREEAEKKANGFCAVIACIRISFEEGEGL